MLPAIPQRFLVRIRKLLWLLILLFSVSCSLGQQSCVEGIFNFNPLKHKKVSGISISNNEFKGLLEYTPAGYNPLDLNKKYPVIIYFHGLGAMGEGTSADLCKIIYDSYDLESGYGLPGRIELGQFPTSITHNGQQFSYIVISPQYKHYSFPSSYPSAQEVSDVIDYVLANYRVDPRRIYLTGMSSGGNMIIEYAAHSVANAQRVAGISLSSVCSDHTSPQNVGAGNTPSNISNGSLATWFVHCETDAPCFRSIPEGWINGINSNPGNLIPPLYTLLDNVNPDPLRRCDGFAHNTWSTMYNPNFRVNGKNLYEWNLQYQSSVALPVKLKTFTANLLNGKVYLKWITSLETDNASFTIERAGTDQRFKAVVTLKANGNSTTEKVYEYVDDKPFDNLSYYRLLQTGLDGQLYYYEIRKILNRSSRYKLLVSPNPFVQDLSVFLNLNKAQRVSLALTDLNGKKLKTIHAMYAEGSTEITVKTSDLPKGIYLLKVESEEFSEIQKVIKQ